jgi:hypothetical protein
VFEPHKSRDSRIFNFQVGHIDGTKNEHALRYKYPVKEDVRYDGDYATGTTTVGWAGWTARSERN